MNGQGKLLTHFLKNADKLIIPVYQRNYDWKEEHCKKLYSDLVKFKNNVFDTSLFINYFVCTGVYRRTSPNKGSGRPIGRRILNLR